MPDPANPQSFNRYSYVYNNPINFTDPSGHDGVWCNDPSEMGAGCGLPNFDLDSGPTNLPIGNWNPDNASNQMRENRANQVRKWFTEYEGPNWWGGPPGSMPNMQQLIAYLLYEEGSVYLGNDGITELMVQIIYTRLGEDPTPRRLSGFTAFFDPNGGNQFDHQDWEELVSLVDKGVTVNIDPYLEIVSNAFEVDKSPYAPVENEEWVLYWWEHWEAQGTDPSAVYKTIGEGNQAFYFGTYSQAKKAGFIK